MGVKTNKNSTVASTATAVANSKRKNRFFKTLPASASEITYLNADIPLCLQNSETKNIVVSSTTTIVISTNYCK